MVGERRELRLPARGGALSTAGSVVPRGRFRARRRRRRRQRAAGERRGHAAHAGRPGRPAPVPGSGPATAARARPQDPPRPAREVQGRTREDSARGGSCGVLRADGALPAVPPDRARPQAGVHVGGAEEDARVPSRGPGGAQGAGGRRRAPEADGLEPGGEPAAARAAVSETAARGAGAGAAAGRGAGPPHPGRAGLDAAEGARSAAVAGGG